MQALRQASRRTLHASVVIQNARSAMVKDYSSKAAAPVAARKSKEERYELVKQFVAKFKAANNGQLPGISLLRKEVGGKYDTLKELLQELSKDEGAVGGTHKTLKENEQELGKGPVTLKQTVKLKDAEVESKEFAAATPLQGRSKQKYTAKGEAAVGGTHETLKEHLQELGKGPDTLKQTIQLKEDTEAETQEFAAAAKAGRKKKSAAKGGESKKDGKETPQLVKGKETPQVSKSSKNDMSVEELQVLHKTTSKNKGQTTQSVTTVNNVSKALSDSFLTSDEDDDDDSDVAAPEYQHIPLIQEARHKMEVGVEADRGKEKMLQNIAVAYSKDDMKKQNGDQALKSKPASVKHVNQWIDSVQKGRETINAVDETAAKHPMTNGSFKPSGPLLTTVARILNLPSHMTANKLKALCERAAKVHDVEYRRGRIVDVQFDVDLHEMNGVINRLKMLSIGSHKLRVCPAQKFFCGSITDSKVKPRDANHYHQVRNFLMYSLEQRFQFLCRQVQDYRELQDLKLAK